MHINNVKNIYKINYINKILFYFKILLKFNKDQIILLNKDQIVYHLLIIVRINKKYINK